MEPHNVPPAPPPISPHSGPQNQYDFIVNPHKPHRRSLFSGGSKKQRIIIAAAGLAGLLILVSIIMTVLNSAGKANTNDLVLAAQQQQELIRISDIGIKKSRTSSVKNKATTTKLTLESDQPALQAIVKKAKRVDSKVLKLGQDASTDQTLTAAEQANRFDEVFTATLQKELSEYQQTLKRVHDSSENTRNKQMLAAQYRNVGLLLNKQ